jgi:hypothetical protein
MKLCNIAKSKAFDKEFMTTCLSQPASSILPAAPSVSQLAHAAAIVMKSIISDILKVFLNIFHAVQYPV